MQKTNDLSRSLGVLEQDSTLIAVIEMSVSLACGRDCAWAGPPPFEKAWRR